MANIASFKWFCSNSIDGNAKDILTNNVKMKVLVLKKLKFECHVCMALGFSFLFLANIAQT